MAAGGGEAHGPMHQFEINRLFDLKLFGYDASFTNASLMMVIAVAVIVGFLAIAMRGRALVPGRLQSMAELAYEFVAKMLRDNTGEEGMKYFPFIFTLFMFVLVANLLGMIPGAFTITSHIAVTAALALVVFLMVTTVGFARHGLGYLRLFVPHGVSWPLLILLVPIEVLSYFIRPISQSVRLFANMMAGHTLLKVFAGFVVMLGAAGGWAPLAFMVPFTLLEVFVALIQAFIFTLLTCIYLNDAIHMHH